MLIGFVVLPATSIANSAISASASPAYNTVDTPQSVLKSSPLPYHGKAEAFAVTPAIRDLPFSPPEGGRRDKFDNYVERWERENKDQINAIVPGAGAGGGSQAFVDPLLQFNSPFAPLAMPSPTGTFEGVNGADRLTVFGSQVFPPDTQGDVGPNHYVSMVNGPVGIYNKTTGALVVPLFKLSTLFASLPAGNTCRTTDNGDPVVMYDSLANRWIITQFGFASSSNPPWFECIAVSQTSDPTGAYFAYAFRTPDVGTFPDYPKLGVWTDAYYMTDHQNGFLPPPGAAGGGTGFFAFDRAKILAGDPNATFIYFNRPTPGEGGILPSDVDGISPPPVGASQLLFRYTADEFGGSFTDAIVPYEFIPNFVTPGASTLTVLAPIPVAAFDARQPANRADIEQPAPAAAVDNLDSLNDRAMYQTSYHNIGTQAAPINSYTMAWGVNVSGAAAGTLVPTTFTSGIRWTEMRRDGAGAMTIRDQGTHADSNVNGGTGTNFWMPHIAQDHDGNIAVGYSASSTTLFPGIHWAGRTGATAGNTLNEGEAVMFAATGSQVENRSRWGDYSSMSVDPSDSCTFYYHTEYRTAANNANAFAWNTRVGYFKFPSCSPAPKGTLIINVANCANGNPVVGALALATGGFAQPTNGAGQASFTVPPGTYTASASVPNSAPTNSTGSVSDGATTTLNVCVTGVPMIASQTATLTAESFAPANNAPDPAEFVTVNFCAINTGLADTVALTGTLAASGNVTNPGPAQKNYGVVAAGGAAVCRPFTFTVNPAMVCGDEIVASINFADGANNFGIKTYALTTGVVSGSATQTVSYAGPAVAVPDNTPAGVNLSLPVSGIAGKIIDADFRFDAAAGGGCSATLGNVNSAMDHTFLGDLVFKLTSPVGTTVTVMSQKGGTRENICTTLLDDDGSFPSLGTVSSTGGQFLSGNFAPDAPLSAFDTQAANGTWVLNVADVANIDTGSMRRFSLVITNQTRTCSTQPLGAAPTVSTAPTQSILEDGSTSVLNVTVNDAEDPAAALILSATSNNTALVPNANIALGGSAAARTVQVTPAANAFGTATITLTVTDGALQTGTSTFDVVVAPVNDAPNFTLTGTLTALAGASGVQTVPGFVTSLNLGPGEGSQTVVGYNVSEFSDPGNIVSAVSIAANGTLSYTLSGAATGVATLRTVLQDSGGTANGGADTSAPVDFSLTIVADAVFANGFE